MESEAAKRIVDDPPGLTSEPLSGKNKSSRVGLKNASHVLVVDDNTICQKVLCRTLANLNCSTEVASNGQQATDKLAAHDVSIYSAVMMDLRMPVMDGLSATRVIRNDLGIKHVPIVAISAERSDELYKDCLNAGMDDFIQKPASKVSIQETLQKLGVLDRDENDENDSP